MSHRTSLLFCSALALIVGVGCSRPQPPAPVAKPPALAAAPAAPAAPATPAEKRPYESPRPDPTRAPTPLPDLSEGEAGDTPPQAGRQVLRCLTRGRITYTELTGLCPEGIGERVTVFPTQGVEGPR